MVNAIGAIGKTNYKVIVFDVDGTLANCEHRQCFLRSKPRNWNAFNAGIPFDKPHEDIIWIARQFALLGHEILIATGRSEEERRDTEDWLKWFEVPYAKMYMRPAKDYRDDAIIKKEILDQMRKDGYEPYMVFDDRDRVVKMWRENNVRCLQVNYGDF